MGNRRYPRASDIISAAYDEFSFFDKEIVPAPAIGLHDITYFKEIFSDTVPTTEDYHNIIT